MKPCVLTLLLISAYSAPAAGAGSLEVIGLAAGLLVAAIGGVQVAQESMEPIVATVWAVSKKARGQAPCCDWNAAAGFYADYREFAKRVIEHQEQLRIERYDD